MTQATDHPAAIRLAKEAMEDTYKRKISASTPCLTDAALERFRQLCRTELLAEQAAKPADGCAHCSSPLFAATHCKNCGKNYEPVKPQQL